MVQPKKTETPTKAKAQPKKEEDGGALAPPAVAEIGRVERGEYEEMKRQAIKFEKRNDQYIVVIPCDGEQGWCEMCERSALIYKYLVCEPIGARCTMTDDMESYYLQYSIGRIRTRGFDTVRKRLKQADMYAREVKKGRCMVFVLKERVPLSEMEKLRETEIDRQMAANDIIKPKYADPTLYQNMVLLATRLHRVCYRRLDKLASSTNGVRMVELSDEMLRKYYVVAARENTTEERIEILRELDRLTMELLVELQIAAGLRLWTRENCIRIAEEVKDVEARIRWNIKHESSRLEKRNSRSQKGGDTEVVACKAHGIV